MNGTLFTLCRPVTASCVLERTKDAVTNLRFCMIQKSKISGPCGNTLDRVGVMRLVRAICRSQKALQTIPVRSRQILFRLATAKSLSPLQTMYLCHPVISRDIKVPDSKGHETNPPLLLGGVLPYDKGFFIIVSFWCPEHVLIREY